MASNSSALIRAVVCGCGGYVANIVAEYSGDVISRGSMTLFTHQCIGSQERTR